MKDLLKYIIGSIVEKSDEVKIDEEEAEGVTNFIVTVSKDDMGRVIGKQGKVIRAIRNTLRIPAMKSGKKIYISLSENPQ